MANIHRNKYARGLHSVSRTSSTSQARGKTIAASNPLFDENLIDILDP
jgi:hypothetical protein